MNENTNRQFELLRQNNEQGFGLQNKMVENQKWANFVQADDPRKNSPMTVPNAASNSNFTSLQMQRDASYNKELALSLDKRDNSQTRNPMTYSYTNTYTESNATQPRRHDLRQSSDETRSPNEQVSHPTPSSPNQQLQSQAGESMKSSIPRQYEYSFQQYQDNNFNFMRNKIGANDQPPARTREELTSPVQRDPRAYPVHVHQPRDSIEITQQTVQSPEFPAASQPLPNNFAKEEYYPKATAPLRPPSAHKHEQPSPQPPRNPPIQPHINIKKYNENSQQKPMQHASQMEQMSYQSKFGNDYQSLRNSRKSSEERSRSRGRSDKSRHDIKRNRSFESNREQRNQQEYM